MSLSLSEAGTVDAAQVLAALGSSPSDLGTEDARRRLAQVGRNAVRTHAARPLAVLARQLNSPLLLLLVAAALVSIVVGQHADAGIILGIIGLSVGLGFANEFRSERAVQALHDRIGHTALTIRDGRAVDVTELVPGDLVRLGWATWCRPTCACWKPLGCGDLGIAVRATLTGAQVEGMDEFALAAAVSATTVFARVAPEQKSRIIKAAREGGDVAFLGDGRQRRGRPPRRRRRRLGPGRHRHRQGHRRHRPGPEGPRVLADGVVEGRRIFANTIKYVLMGPRRTSATCSAPPAPRCCWGSCRCCPPRSC
jgi:magnesium-transporting ATPase (P-type)